MNGGALAGEAIAAANGVIGAEDGVIAVADALGAGRYLVNPIHGGRSLRRHACCAN
jgi:hypothetical protein